MHPLTSKGNMAAWFWGQAFYSEPKKVTCSFFTQMAMGHTQPLGRMRGKYRGQYRSILRSSFWKWQCVSTRQDSSGTCLVSACILLLPHASLIKGKYHLLIVSHLLILRNTFCHLLGLSFCSWQNPQNSLFWDEEIRKFSICSSFRLHS